MSTTTIHNLLPHRYWIIITDDDGDDLWLESYASRKEARAELSAVAAAYPHHNIRIEKGE